MSFDLIIIGAGTAGCIMAKRSKSSSMIILERGTDQHNNPIVYNPANGAKASSPPYSERLPTAYEGTTVSVAKLYGGASSHNYGLVVHGSQDFYENNWKELGITYPKYIRIFKKIERYTGKSQAPETRGTSGELVVSQFPRELSIGTQIWSFLSSKSIVEAPKSLEVFRSSGPLGAKDPFSSILTYSFGLSVVEDYNTGIADCACKTPQVFVDNITGLRSSVDVTYLKDLRNKVVPQATVERIWENGVSWSDSNGNMHFTSLNPGGKIILCAGAIYTPRILMKSGIPNIGEGLMQHYGFQMVLRIPGVQDFSTGPVAFAKNRHWQIVTGGKTLIPPKFSGGNVTFLFWLLKPKARGRVTPDKIELNLFPEEDLSELVQGAHYMYEVIQNLRIYHPNLELISPTLADFKTEILLRQAIQENLSLTDHYSGTCRLGDLVNPEDFSLKGYPHIHVVDASVFPELPDGNTEFPVAVMAEIAAERL